MPDLLGVEALSYRLVILLTAGILAVQSVSASSAGCPKGLSSTTAMERHGDLCYQFVSQEKYWSDARKYCLQNGGRLVKIDNSETNSFIVDTLNGLWWANKGVWIGLHDTQREMHFQWTGFQIYENEPAGDWTNWGRGHPRAFFHSIRDCVRMVRGNGEWKWHETPCSSMKWHYRFICEYKAVSNEEGMHLAQTKDKPMPENQLHEKSTSSPILTTARSSVSTSVQPTTVTEQQTDNTGSFEEYERQFDDELNSLEKETQTALNSLTTTGEDDEMQTTFHEDFVEEAEEEEEEEAAYFAVVDRVSYEQMEKLDDTRCRDVRLTLILGFCLAAVCAFLVGAFLIYQRRRKAKLAKSDDSDDKEIKNKMAKENPSTNRSAVANIYVIGDVTNSSHFPRKFSEGEHPVSYNYLPTRDDGAVGRECHPGVNSGEGFGMTGSDSLTAINLYAEIPEEEEEEEEEKEEEGEEEEEAKAEVEHIYESLDECIDKIIL